MSQIVAFKTVAITGTGIGDTTIVAAVSGRPIRVWKIFFTAAGATNVTFKDGASTSLSGAVQMTSAGSSFTLAYDGSPWFSTVPGNGFVINSSAAQALSGTCYYTEG